MRRRFNATPSLFTVALETRIVCRITWHCLSVVRNAISDASRPLPIRTMPSIGSKPRGIDEPPAVFDIDFEDGVKVWGVKDRPRSWWTNRHRQRSFRRSAMKGNFLNFPDLGIGVRVRTPRNARPILVRTATKLFSF